MKHCYTTEWDDGTLIIWDNGRTSNSVRVYEDGDQAVEQAKLASLLQKREPFIITKHLNFVEAKLYIQSRTSPDQYKWIHYYELPRGYRDRYGEKEN